MTFSSENDTAPLFFCGEIETSRLKFSSGIKNFDRESLPFPGVFADLRALSRIISSPLPQ